MLHSCQWTRAPLDLIWYTLFQRTFCKPNDYDTSDAFALLKITCTRFNTYRCLILQGFNTWVGLNTTTYTIFKGDWANIWHESCKLACLCSSVAVKLICWLVQPQKWNIFIVRISSREKNIPKTIFWFWKQNHCCAGGLVWALFTVATITTMTSWLSIKESGLHMGAHHWFYSSWYAGEDPKQHLLSLCKQCVYDQRQWSCFQNCIW